MGAGLGKDVAALTDGQFSGNSSFIIGHVCPEAQEGSPIAAVKDGPTPSHRRRSQRHRDEGPLTQCRQRQPLEKATKPAAAGSGNTSKGSDPRARDATDE
ncbi:MAG: dihydroxy-acid dehydratase [Phycisphaerales bacterium]